MLFITCFKCWNYDALVVFLGQLMFFIPSHGSILLWLRDWPPDFFLFNLDAFFISMSASCFGDCPLNCFEKFFLSDYIQTLRSLSEYHGSQGVTSSRRLNLMPCEVKFAHLVAVVYAISSLSIYTFLSLLATKCLVGRLPGLSSILFSLTTFNTQEWFLPSKQLIVFLPTLFSFPIILSVPFQVNSTVRMS